MLALDFSVTQEQQQQESHILGVRIFFLEKQCFVMQVKWQLWPMTISICAENVNDENDDDEVFDNDDNVDDDDDEDGAGKALCCIVMAVLADLSVT